MQAQPQTQTYSFKGLSSNRLSGSKTNRLYNNSETNRQVQNKANTLYLGTPQPPPIVNLDLTDSYQTSITETGSGGVGLDITERKRFPAAYNAVFELETTTLEEAHYPKPRFWKDSDFKSATTYPDRLAYEIDVLITQTDNPQNLVSALEKLTLEGSTYRVRKTVARRLLKYAEPERSKILLARLAKACRLAVIENADSNESLLMTVSRSVINLLIADHPRSVAKWMVENDCQNQLATFLSVIQPEDRAEILTLKVEEEDFVGDPLVRFLCFKHKQGLFQDMNEESLLSVLNVTGLSIVRGNVDYLIDLIKDLDTNGNSALTDQKYDVIKKLGPGIIKKNPDAYLTLYNHLEDRDSSFPEKKNLISFPVKVVLNRDFESFIKLLSKLSTEQLDHFLNQSDIMTEFGQMVSDEKISKQLFEVLSLLTEQEQKNILETRLKNSGKSLACTIFEKRDTDDLLKSYQILLSCDIEGESFVSYAVKKDKDKLASLIGWLPPADCLDLLKQRISLRSLEGVTIGQLLSEQLIGSKWFRTGAFLKKLTEEDLFWILNLETGHKKTVISSLIDLGKSDLVKGLLLKLNASNRGNVLNKPRLWSMGCVASKLYFNLNKGEFLRIINGMGSCPGIRGDALISMLSSNYSDGELGSTNLVHAFIQKEPIEFNKLLDKLSIEDMKLLYQIVFDNQTVGQWMAQNHVNDIFSQLEKLPTVDEKSDFLKIRLSNETSLFSTIKEAHPELLHEFVRNLGSNDKKARFLMSQIQDGADASVNRDIFNEFLDCFEGINGNNVEIINKDELIRLITLSPTELTEEFKTVFTRIGLSFEPDSLNSKGLSLVLLSEAKQNWLKGFLATLERSDLKIAIENALEHGPETFITHLAKQLDGEFNECVFQRNLKSFIGDLIEITGNEGETKTISIILNQSRRDKAKRSEFLLKQYQRQLNALIDAPDSDDKTAKIEGLNEKIRKIENDVRLEAGWQEKEFEGTKHTFFEAYSVEKKGEFKNGDLKDQSGIDKTNGEIETYSTISYYDKHAGICESTRGVFKEGQHFGGEVRLYEKNKTYKAGFRRLRDGNMQCSDWVEEIGAEEYVVNFSKLLGWNGIQFGSNSNSSGEISSSSEEVAYINSIYSEQPLVSKYSDNHKAFLEQITDLEGHFLSYPFKSKLPEIENYNTSIQDVFEKVRTIINSAEDEGKKNSLKAFFESIAYSFSLDSTKEEMKNMACIQIFDQVRVCAAGFTATVQNMVSYLKSSNTILGTIAQLREHIITQEVWPKIQQAINRNISEYMFIHWQQALLLLAHENQISLASDVSAFNDPYAAPILTELKSNYFELFYSTYLDSYTPERCVSYISGKIKDHVSDLLKGQLDEDLIVSIKKECGDIELSEGQLESAKCTKLIEESEEMFEAILSEFLHNDVEIDQDFIRQFLSPLKIMLNNALDKVKKIDSEKYESILIQIESERYSEDSIRNLIGLVRGEDKLLQKLYVKNDIVEELENQNTKINFDSLFRMAYIPKKFQYTVGAIETESAEYKGEPDVKEEREIALKQAFPDLIPMNMPSEEVSEKEKELLVFPKVETSGTAQYAYLRPNWTDAVETRVMRQLFETEVLQERLPVRRGFQFIG